ncbi:MAG: apolipoprotein N-acyltransferase [Nitrospinae bacterium]|nr:apolipoprotein N-acyltransferase [Nitrospinota bacterium]
MRKNFFGGYPGGRPAGLALLSGILLTLAFPPFGLHFAAFFAFVPLLAALDGKRPATALLLGLAAGFVFFAATIPWLYTALSVYGHINTPLSILLMLLLDIYLALFFAIFAWLASRCTPGEAVIMAPVYFVALEWARETLFSGFPWALLGESQYAAPAMIQIASFTGVAGVSFLIMFVNAAVNYFLRQVKQGAASPLIPLAALAVVALNVFWGMGAIGALEKAGGVPFTAALVQGNIAQDEKWDPRFQDMVMGRYLGMTREAALKKPDIIIWPEAAVPFYFGNAPHYTGAVRAAARETGTPLLFGGLAFERGPLGEDRYFNSAFLIAPDGREYRYDKIHLVPFGEYVPYRSILSFARSVTNVIGGDVTAGESTEPIRVDGVTAGMQICYEIIFPEGSRAFAQRGARLMVNLTNDAWYGRSAASAQEMTALPFRAVENRLPVLRAANTGISAAVTASGKIVHPTALFETITAVETVIIPPVAGQTFYTRFGGVFAYACVAMAVWHFIAGGWRRRKEP